MSALREREAGTLKTVYLLGAGASAASDYGLPTMRGFFDVDSEIFPEELRRFLAWYYPGRDANQYNLEEVLSYLHLTERRGSLWGHPTSPEYALPNLLDYVVQRLQIGEQPCTKHAEISRVPRCDGQHHHPELRPRDRLGLGASPRAAPPGAVPEAC